MLFRGFLLWTKKTPHLNYHHNQIISVVDKTKKLSDAKVINNPNLGGLFKGSFCLDEGAMGGLKLTPVHNSLNLC